jgi:uncharacterized protein YbbC (DUF1343 family)/CubicO group peptidase (beta-lactamase class C family)
VKRRLAAALILALAASLHRTRAQSAFEPIAPLVNAAIDRHELPGAVVLVGRGDDVVYRAAFGRRAVAPEAEPMTDDTIFDLASLTKVVATTTSVMQLIEQGQVRLRDPVARFIPEFGAQGKEAITIQQLLTHTSGLAPDLPLEESFHGSDEAIRRASALTPASAPGEKFVYSDINFFLLGDIVRRVSGQRLDEYAAAHLFAPLRMTDTRFLPPDAWRARIAPTERCLPLAWPCSPSTTLGAGDPAAPFLRGIVHDPTARRMDGVAGHAGLFSTAADLSRFCRMLLHGGELDGVRILSPASVERMTSPSTPPGMKDVRGLGWDIDSSYSSNRGDFFPAASSFGHTGFTGTSLWIDKKSRGYVVFLSNRVHPDGKGDVTALRGKVATVAAAALSLTSGSGTGGSRLAVEPQAPSPKPRVMSGIDVLAADGFASLRGKRVGLVTNHTGVSRSGASTIDLLAHAPGVTLVALFSPEHGIRGQQDDLVESGRDEKTGLPVFSLYGKTRRPTDDMLKGVDALLVDLQDIGARFWTYATTMEYVVEEAARRKIAVVVLDRPNPIGGDVVEGPMQDAGAVGFTGYVTMPIRHGLTLGELARLFNAERHVGADLTVVAMRNWRRDAWFDESGAPWVAPSPNMRNLIAATLYPGIGAIEQTNVSVGRGTDTPFEQIGAPWIDGAALASALSARGVPGVSVYPVTFTPAAGAKFAGERCGGVFVIVTDRNTLRPVRLGVEIASVLVTLYGSKFDLEAAATQLGSKAAIARIRAGEDPVAIVESFAADVRAWRVTRAPYLLY